MTENTLDSNNLPAELREKELTPRQQAFLDVLFTDAEGDIRKAMDLAGYSKSTKIQDVVSALHDQIQELTRQFMATSTPSAFFRVVDIMKNPTKPGANISLKAATEILDRGGLEKGSQTKTDTQVQNIFILPEKKVDGKTVITIETDNQEVIDVDYEVLD